MILVRLCTVVDSGILLFVTPHHDNHGVAGVQFLHQRQAQELSCGPLVSHTQNCTQISLAIA